MRFVMLVVLGLGTDANWDIYPFTDARGCHEAAAVVVSLMPSPVRAICLDTQTGSITSRALRD